MAEGDAVSAYMGTGNVNRQPSSGVVEQITAIVKPSGTDAIRFTDGTAATDIFDSSSQTDGFNANGNSIHNQEVFNLALMINNTVYLDKAGTTDRVYVGGVEVD